MNTFKKVLMLMIILGIIILSVGLYYQIIKAGIPYQDPTAEMQIQYNKDMSTGETLTMTGFCITTVAAVCRIIAGLLGRKRS